MRKITIAATALILFTLALNFNSFAGRDLLELRPAVELFYPVTQDIDLSAKSSLQFRWREINITQTDHYEFKLYKGYDMVGSALVLKQDVSGDGCPLELAEANFEINQVYTWSLKQIYLGGQKSERSYGTFKIIKK